MTSMITMQLQFQKLLFFKFIKEYFNIENPLMFKRKGGYFNYIFYFISKCMA